MSAAIGGLIIGVCILLFYIVLLQRQLHSINRQLCRRLTKNTRQPVGAELINPELNHLIIQINKCLKSEENLRLESLREEKQFKELIANISHDLRTPLTAIKGYQQLLENGPLTEGQQEKLRVAQKYADELGHLIEQFFEYSYLENAAVKINLEPVNLTALVTECLAGAVALFEERGLRVNLKESSAVTILADRPMTERIVLNLIRNCAAHAAGDIAVAVTASETAEIFFGNPVESPDDIDAARLFDRFYTGDRARRKTTGLGLSIVKLLAGQMGGSVGADLQGNQLSIRVQLPLYKK